MSPTQRSIAFIKQNGGFPWIVEHWNPFARIRQDLFGFADILVIYPGKKASHYVQVTSGSGVSARKHKILSNKYSKAVLEAGNTIEIHGWRKTGAAGKRKTWNVRVEPITLSCFYPQEQK